MSSNRSQSCHVESEITKFLPFPEFCGALINLMDIGEIRANNIWRIIIEIEKYEDAGGTHALQHTDTHTQTHTHTHTHTQTHRHKHTGTKTHTQAKKKTRHRQETEP